MSSEHTVQVDLDSRSYNIHIGSGLIENAPKYLPFSLSGKSVFILTDQNVDHAGYSQKLENAIKKSNPSSLQKLVLEPGEKSKSFDVLENVLSWMLDNGVNRQSVLFTLGGGVVGDLGGFAASIVMRGISFVQVPTTLLAQVDSSVGGKTAIDTVQGKNLVGTFYQPAAVICDINALISLPKRELLAGYAEIIKYGLINDLEFYNWLILNGETLCDLDTEKLAHAVKVSCIKKAEIVAEDEKEAGTRALLNFGHTFAHMLEGVAGYDGKLLHGEAVAIGMVMAMKLSAEMGYINSQEVHILEEHLKHLGLPVAINDIEPKLNSEASTYLSYLKKDKKATADHAVFILSKGVGKAFISHDVNVDDVRDIISHSIKG